MRRTAWSIAVLACVLTIIGTRARAQDEPSFEAATDGPDQERALHLFEESLELYRTGRFADAAVLLREAYSLHAEPVLLYNLARALEGDGDLDGAIDAYQRYLETAGEIPDRGAIERKLETLRATVAERNRLAEAAEDAERREREREREAEARRRVAHETGRSPSPAPWIVAGVGAAGFAVAGVLGALALGAHDAAIAAPSQRETDAEQRRANDYALATNIAFIASGVVLAAGVIWGVIDVVSAGGDEPVATARLRLLPHAAVFEGRFP
jgi:tetratricopeptide (TPR) repeat protein